MKKILTSTIIGAALSVSASAAISLLDSDSSSTGNTLLYGATFFSNVSVNAGDVVVLTHANNKHDNGSNTISASIGSETVNTIGAGPSGGQAGAWIFYSTITTTGDINISFDTSNSTKKGSKVSGYYILRADPSETISLASSASFANVADGTHSLDFDAAATNGVGVLAFSNQANATALPTPTGWTEDLNTAERRAIFSSSNVTNLSPSFATSGGDFEAAAGAVFTAAAVPEPSSTALLGLGGLALILRRRK